MRVLYQPSSASPADWLETDAKDWHLLSTLLEPNRVCVQGVEFTAGHYAVEDLGLGVCRVTTWDDGPDYADGWHYAYEVTFEPLGPDADPRYRGRINTRQRVRAFGEPLVLARMLASGPVQNTEFFPWEEFVPPVERDARHGIWLPDGLYREHESIRTRHGWREWTEGLAQSELDAKGWVKVQRPLGRYLIPLGTRTYFLTSTDRATFHAVLDIDNENAFEASAGPGDTEMSGNLAGSASGLLFVFTSDANEPDSAAWPTGDYNCHLDVPNAGAGITYGLRAAGTATGHFARVNAGLTADEETKPQTEPLFSLDGIKDASTGSVSWTGGLDTDRFECLVAGTRAVNHGNQNVDLTFDADAFADGPWPAAITEGEIMAAVGGGPLASAQPTVISSATPTGSSRGRREE